MDYLLLQWGRGDEAADTPVNPFTATFESRLQWGRGDEAADTEFLRAQEI